MSSRRQAASRWSGFLSVRAEIVAQKRFTLRSVVATKLNFLCFFMKRKGQILDQAFNF